MHSTMRKKIERGFAAFGHLIYRHHWKTLMLMALMVAALVSQLPKLTLDTSTEGFLHTTDPTLLAYNDFRDRFGRDELILVTIEAEQGVFNGPFLDKLRALHTRLENELPYLDDITSLVNARNTVGAEGALIVGDLLDPWPEDAAALERVQQQALANPLYRNLLLSEDATVTTIVIKTDAYSHQDGGSDVLAGFDDTTPAAAAPRHYLTDAENSEVVQAVQQITAEFNGPDFRIHNAGSPVVSDVLKRVMQENMKRFMGLALLTIGIILFLLFRRFSGVVLPLIIVILALLSTLGLMGALGIPFKLPTQIMPSFLLAVGVGAAVHLLSIFYNHMLKQHERGEQVNKENAIAHALGHSGLAIVMASLTTAAGLLSFAGAEVAPVADLGVIAASGVLLALIYTIVLLPALLSVMPIRAAAGRSASTRRQRMDALLTTIADFSTSKPKLILIISALIFAVGLAGALQVRFTHKPFEWLPKSNPARQATDFIDSRLKGASSVEVIVDSGRENGLYEPSTMAALERLGREVETISEGELFVGKTLSLADILKETNKALNENRAEFYTIPDNRELIAQEFLLFANSGSDDLEDFTDSAFRTVRFTAKMPWVDGTLYTDFIKDIKQRFHRELGSEVEVTVTGMAALLGRTMHAAIISTAESYLWAALAITVMMVLLIGDLRLGLVSMIPNLLPIVLTIGLMGWLDIKMDMFTMLIGSIAIGLAVDDTIHFMHNYRRYHHDSGDVQQAVRSTLLTTGRAMLVTTIVLATGFFIYMFSTLTKLVDFGLLTGFTIIMALLADFFVAPALMAVMAKRTFAAEESND